MPRIRLKLSHQNANKEKRFRWIYTERQKKLITSSERHSLKFTTSKLIIFGHSWALILLNQNIWKKQRSACVKKEKNVVKSQMVIFSLKNRRNCSPSSSSISIPISINFNGGLCNRYYWLCLWRNPSPGGEEFLQWFLICDHLRFHRIFSFFVSSKPLFFVFRCA